MIKNIKFFIILIFLLCYNSLLFAENKILFIDINFIFLNSTAGKKVNDKIKAEAKKINTETINYQKELDKDKDELISQKNVLSQEELQKKSISLEEKAKNYNKIISTKNNELSEFKKNSDIRFYQELTKIVQEYAKDNSVEMIVKKQNILIGKSSLDATQEVLNIFNKKIKNLN